MLREIRASRARGLSLTELMTALGIAAVLAGAAAPGMAQLVTSRQADTAVEQMRSAVQFTRHVAVARRVVATLCPGDGTACGARDTWHEGAMIFLDANGNSRFDAGEEVVRRLPPLATGYRVYWRSFRNRKSLSMKPTGVTDWQNGSMLLCPPDADPKNARQLIVNAAGRARLARDSDGDGIVEGARGNPVSCRTD